MGKEIIKSKAELKRIKTSDAVCREVRWQMAKHGGIADNNKLFDLLSKWMKVAKKSKYTRPK